MENTNQNDSNLSDVSDVATETPTKKESLKRMRASFKKTISHTLANRYMVSSKECKEELDKAIKYVQENPQTWRKQVQK